MIVVGVLIALAVDSWWAGRRDADSEVAYLSAIFEDLRADSAEFEIMADANRSGSRSARKTIELLEAEGHEPLSPFQVVQTVLCGSFLTLPVVSRTTIDDLLSTGNLRLIEDRDLRREILAYYGAIEYELQWAGEYRDSQRRYRQVLADVRFAEVSDVETARGLDDNQVGLLLNRLRDHPDALGALNGMVFGQGRMVAHLGRLREESAHLAPRIAEAVVSRGGRPPEPELVAASSDPSAIEQVCIW